MEELEIIGERLAGKITSARIFDDNGQLMNTDLLYEILDLPYVYILLSHVDEWQISLMNRKLSNKLEISLTPFDAENSHLFTHNIDPSSLMHLLSVFYHFTNKGQNTIPGILNLTEREDDMQICSDLAIPIAFNKEGNVTFYIHIFCEMENYAIAHLNAYAKYDLNSITQRQQETLKQLLSGDSYPQIAERMGISPRTLEKHVRAIYDMIGCANQGELISFCNGY